MRVPIFELATGREASSCRVLVFGLLGAAKPSLAHAVPRSPFFEIGPRFPRSEALIGVLAKHCGLVHGALRSIPNCKNDTRYCWVPIAPL